MTAPAFVLIPGAGGAGWYWHLTGAELERRGYTVIAPDLPADDESAGLPEYTAAVMEAIDRAPTQSGTDQSGTGQSGTDQGGIIVCGQSLGGFTAAQVAQEVPVRAIVFLNAMIPNPDETAGAWWDNTGQGDAMRESDIAHGREPDSGFDENFYFLHDLTPEVIRSGEGHVRPQGDAVFGSVCDFPAWPPVPIHVLVGRDDRFFPAEFQQRVALERLGLVATLVPGGHLAALSYPTELADALSSIADSVTAGESPSVPILDS